MTPLKISDLPNVEWKPCTRCKGDMSKGLKRVIVYTCPHCQGHGVEPVAVENPMLRKNAQSYSCQERELQVGVPFGVSCGHINETECRYKSCISNVKKFLPIREKVDGDLSVLMVVKAND